MSASVKIIGICGYPKHGKSTAQGFLERFGVRAIDDSLPLRLLTMERYGLSLEDVTTQEGKAKLVARRDYGDIVQVRQAIGDLGKEYEYEHGPNYWIERAIEAIDGDSPVSFGSVRMSQGHAIRAAGGMVIEIFDPRRPTSPHDFDQYDRDAVDARILNNWNLDALETRIVTAAGDYLGVNLNQWAVERVAAHRAEGLML